MFGFVKKIVPEKNYLFIRAEDKRDYFAHANAFAVDFNALAGGEDVEFDPSRGPKGLRAENVRLRAL